MGGRHTRLEDSTQVEGFFIGGKKRGREKREHREASWGERYRDAERQRDREERQRERDGRGLRRGEESKKEGEERKTT